MRKAMSPVPPAMSRIASPGRGFTRRDEAVLPQPVQAARHQVVHQVVAARDASEKTPPTRRVFSSGVTSSSPK